jgi:hypothetical protein
MDHAVVRAFESISSSLDASLEFCVTVETCIKCLAKSLEQLAIDHVSNQCLVHVLGAATRAVFGHSGLLDSQEGETAAC